MPTVRRSIDETELSTSTYREPDLEFETVSRWLSSLGCLTIFAGLASILGSHPQKAWARDIIASPQPSRVARNARMVEKAADACSKPELLRRQSEYRLPGQKTELNVLNLMAGSDNCPGTPIPAGTYTVAVPFTDSGNTTGANNTVTSENCTYNYYYNTAAGPDNVYSFTLSARGPSPRIEVSTTSNTYSTYIYILSGIAGSRCPSGTANYASSCLAAKYTSAPGATTTLGADVMNSLPLNVPLHLFVDSGWYSTANNQGPYTVRMQDVTVRDSVFPPANDAALDMNGDGRSDFVIVRNSGGQLTWHTRHSNDIFGTPAAWGADGDKLVPADYDGDGKDDIAVWRPGAQGRFYIFRSSTQTMHTDEFGQTGDDPTVVADYTGDGIDDVAVYRPGGAPAGQSYWFYRNSSLPGGFARIAWGEHGDRPAPGDYDGDGRADHLVQRAETAAGRFYLRTHWNQFRSDAFGLPGDRLVPGDYDGDGVTDLAVVRPGDDGILIWEYKRSSAPSGASVRHYWGVAATDTIAPSDYDGDGRTEFAVWRPGSPGTFFIRSSDGTQSYSVGWGETGDVPAASFNVR